MKERSVFVAVIGAVAAVLLGGCGSNSKGPTTASYVSQANKICVTYEAKAKALPEPADTATVADVKRYLSSATSLVNQESQKLKALPKPRSGGGKFLAVYAKQATDARELDTAANASSATQLRSALQRLKTDSRSLDTQFDAVGLRTCGSGS